MKIIASTAAALLAAATFAGSAIASERAPSAAEAAAIGDAMKSQGFSAWGKVELDDGKWEVDNAVHSDGRVYDVDLRVSDLGILKRELED